MEDRDSHGLKGSAGATHREDDRYGGQVQENNVRLVGSRRDGGSDAAGFLELIFPSGFLP